MVSLRLKISATLFLIGALIIALWLAVPVNQGTESGIPSGQAAGEGSTSTQTIANKGIDQEALQAYLKQQSLKQLKDKLTEIREVRKARIEDFFDRLQNQVLTFSNDLMIIDAMGGFRNAYERLEQDYSDLDSSSLTVSDEGLTTSGKILQHLYIHSNPNPDEQKDLLIDLDDGKAYSRVHKFYHPYLKHYQERFGLRDVLLIEAESGNVVYSVFKQSAIGTSLLTGPLQSTSLASVFKGALQTQERDSSVITDFKPYQPDGNKHAAFVASPIYLNNRLLGVLAFQLQPSQLVDLISHSNGWSSDAGSLQAHTYIIGADNKLRSETQLFLDSNQNGLTELNDEQQQAVELQKSLIGIVEVSHSGVDKALSGEAGIVEYQNNNGETVYGSVALLNIPGLVWGVITEQVYLPEAPPSFSAANDSTTATTAPPANHNDSSARWVAIVGTILLITAAIFTIPAMASQSLDKLSDVLESFADSDHPEDLALIEQSGPIYKLQQKFQAMMQDMQQEEVEVQQDNESLERSLSVANNLVTTSKSLIQDQQQKLENTKPETDELQNWAHQVREKVQLSQEQGQSIEGQIQQGSEAIQIAIDSIENMANKVDHSVEVVSNLNQHSDAIGNILDVIRNIADQTNLLALNAAIEAARAGDHGRGFAVVADEVRTLAHKTQESTNEIQVMIEDLQKGSAEASAAMESEKAMAAESVNKVQHASELLAEIQNSIMDLRTLANEIDHASLEQSQCGDRIQNLISTTLRVTEQATSKLTAQQQELAEISRNPGV